MVNIDIGIQTMFRLSDLCSIRRFIPSGDMV